MTMVVFAPLVSGVSYSAEAEALFTQMDTDGTAPDATRKGHINTLIVALKSAGIWAKCDRIYVLAAHEATAALIDWKTPGTDTLTAAGSPTFTVDRGFTGDGVDNKLTGATNYSSFTQFTQNSAHLSVWNRSTGVDDTILIGIAAAATSFIRPRNALDQLGGFRCNGGATTGGANGSVPDASGFFVSNRIDSTEQKCYRNGTQVGATGAVTSVSPAASPLSILYGNTSTFSSSEAAAATVGAGLTSTELTDQYDALLAYLQAVGAA